jgi:hypothetical protein
MIKAGTFKPDQTRSGYIVPQPKAVPISGASFRAMKDKGELVPREVDSDDSSSSSSSDSGNSKDDSDDEVLSRDNSNKRVRHEPELAALSYYLHKRWKTLHLFNIDRPEKLKCGRTITPLYASHPFLPAFEYSRCSDCFRS